MNNFINTGTKYTLLIIALFVLALNVSAQGRAQAINVDELSLEEIKGMTQDDLLQVPFEDLILLVKKFKLSSIDELYALLLNPTQSTASKMEEDVFNAPLATTVLTADELEKSGARSIPEALKLAPGIIVREKTNGNYDIHIRGNDYIAPGSDFENTVNSSTLVMIDNRPVYNSFLGATFWENLPVSVNDIEKIEIVYGPSASLYGPNAVSGVIHLITKKVMEDGVKTEFDVQAGNNNEKVAYGAVRYKKGDWGIKLSGNYQKADRFQDSYYILEEGKNVSGDQVGDLNAQNDTTFNASEFSSDYSNALDKGAVNLGITYSPSEKINIAYSGSYQSSSAQTAYMDLGSVLTSRESSSFSNSINLNIGKFEGHFSGVAGKLNAVEGLPGYEYDYTELNGKIGYNFKYKNLLVRPGIDANYAYYSDEDYVDVEANTGLLNGSAELGTVQGSLRLDYTAFDKLRIVGAWMQGYFYKPERSYNSYQFTSSYKAADHTILRLVASKSNSGLFILNTYMNKSIQVPVHGEMQNTVEGDTWSMNMVGNENLSPMEMNMLELGVRHRFKRNLQADISLFYNRSKNYSEMVRDESGMEAAEPGDEENTAPTRMAGATQSMQNIDLESHQYGVTASVKYVLNEKFNASLFATYQQTELKDYEVTEAYIYEGLTGETIDNNELAESAVYLDLDHDYTPKFYGGATFNYAPASKWNFNASLYAYSKQESFYTKGQEFYNIQIDPKISGNLKASYQVNDWMNVYVNARNITNDSAREFMFTDKTGGTYLGGIHICF